ncbi:10A19I.15 [Zea mays]|uniref:10A19I.15 n=1 Tax=Zea mays TaxID=4577 RepID=A0A1D6GCN9_MAIZE|nr:10A19I.15 [Zea mays]
MPPPSASASRLATHWIADALADDESLDFSVLKALLGDSSKSLAGAPEATRERVALRCIQEVGSSGELEKDLLPPLSQDIQEYICTKKFTLPETSFQLLGSFGELEDLLPPFSQDIQENICTKKFTLPETSFQLAPPNPLRPAPHPTIPFCRFKEVKNGCHSSVVEMKHYDLCTMNLNEVLSRVEEMSQEEASVCGLMDMDEPSPPSCDDSVEVEDDSCYEGLTDAEWAAENYADWEELYNRRFASQDSHGVNKAERRLIPTSDPQRKAEPGPGAGAVVFPPRLRQLVFNSLFTHILVFNSLITSKKPFEAKFFNKPLENYHYMAVIFGNHQATGLFAKCTSDPLGFDTSESAGTYGVGYSGDLAGHESNNASPTRDSGESLNPSGPIRDGGDSSTRSGARRKRGRMMMEDEDPLICTVTEAFKTLSDAIKQSAPQPRPIIPPNLWTMMKQIPVFEREHIAHYYGYLCENPALAYAFLEMGLDDQMVWVSRYIKTHLSD